MRIDKFLKVSRIIKRRTVANEVCDNGRVTVNGKVVRASYSVKENDHVKIQFGNRTVSFLIKSVKDTTGKDNASELYEIIDE